FSYTITDGTDNVGGTATLDITPVNDAPVLLGGNDLGAIAEDDLANTGTLVATLIAGQVIDSDGSGQGIAIIAVDSTNGTWEFTTDGGVTWTDLGTPDSQFARLLASDANTSVRFLPNPDFSGTVSNAITFHAWDQTSGANGDVVNLSNTDIAADDFEVVSYSSNNGSAVWRTDWIENDSSGGGATSGDLFVGSGTLHVAAGDSGEGLYRELDLSGATTASLAFDYQNLLSGEDEIRVRISNDGGSTYTTEMIFSGSVNAGVGSATIDLTAYIASDTRIQFHVFKNDKGDHILIDNLVVTFDNNNPSPGGATAFSATIYSSDVTVTPVNDAPTTAPVALAAIIEDSGVRTITQAELLSAAGDVDGDSLTATGLAISSGSGTLVDNGDGTWDYTPAANDDTSVNFSYTITDGTDNVAGTASLDITPVNDAPTTSPVVLAAIAEDSGARTITQAELLFAAADIEGDSLTATGLAISSGSGTLVDNGDGTWDYTPAANDDTSVSFSYTITDGTDNVAGAATLDVTPVNDAPTTNAVVLAAIAEDSGVRTITQAELLFAAGDIEGDSLTATGLSISSGSGTLVDNGDGTWDYTPAANDDTSVSFSYTITDGTDNVAGTASLDITPVNDAPTTSPFVLAAIAEDSGVRTITQAELLSAAGDIDGDSLTAIGLAISSGLGTLVDNGDGTWDYTPAANDDTSVSFSYTVTDGTDNVAGTATLDITPVNDSPTLSINTGLAVAEGSVGVTVSSSNLLATDADDSGVGLVYTITDATDNGTLNLIGVGTLGVGDTFTQADVTAGNVTYSHDDSETTSDSFAFSLADGGEDGSILTAGTFIISVIPVNDHSLTAISDIDLTANSVAENTAVGTVIGITAFADDADSNDSVLYSLIDDAGGRFAIDGVSGAVTVSGSLDFESSSSADINVRATSTDGSSLTQVFHVSITNVNEAPTATPDSFSVIPGQTLSVSGSGVVFNDSDVDGDALALILVTPPSNGTFSLLPGGTFTYTPNANFFGQDSFFYRLTDGTLTSNTVQVTIDVPLTVPVVSIGATQSSTDTSTSSSPPGLSDSSDVSGSPEPSNLSDSSDLGGSSISSDPAEPSSPTKQSTTENSSTSSDSPGNPMMAVASPWATQPPGSENVSPSGERSVESIDGRLGDLGLEPGQQQFLGLLSSSDQVAALTQGYSPELASLERLLKEDLAQAIVWAQWDDDRPAEETPMMVYVGMAGAGMSVFSIGYVFWALRGGALMTVFASSLPAWRFIDPIAMLSAYRSTKVGGDEKLDSLIG
ncbi:MAG: cadherin-like domain-containing protein, partial [Planctomycetales bacterium]|nr:cadherin-like domain-containing protein [Planctomycetales bacterium]